MFHVRKTILAIMGVTISK